VGEYKLERSPYVRTFDASVAYESSKNRDLPNRCDTNVNIRCSSYSIDPKAGKVRLSMINNNTDYGPIIYFNISGTPRLLEGSPVKCYPDVVIG
jgi:hypothetical protein